ncbi:MAG: NADP-dependent oxidoreductase [Gammaproteobacteria bacterium]|nr:NADP-dependent oxidoreductase [Gammaproteobacteria bacterium]
MQAIQIQQFGGPEVLTLHEVATPQPAADELLVRVHAAGVNPVDTGARSGRSAALTNAAPPYVPGFDISGVVVAKGSAVTGFSIDDPVYAMLDLRRGGGYAEYALVKESEAASMPNNLTFAEAAALPLVALTAWQALFDTADLQAGQTVLIHGGAGGVGSIAVQLAKWRGARVIATGSDYSQEFLRELGADVTVDYRNQRFEDIAIDVDMVLDTVGRDTQVRSLGVLREGGILVSLVGLVPEARNPPAGVRAQSILVRADGSQLQQIGNLLAEGIIRSVVSYRFPLAAAPEAHRQSETRSTRGKIVLETGL